MGTTPTTLLLSPPSPSPAPISSPPPPLNPSTNSPTPFDGRDRGGVVGLIGIRRTPYRRSDVDDDDRKTSHISRTHLYDIRKVRDPLGRTYLYGMSEGTGGVEACGRKGFGGVGLGGSEFTVKSSRTDSEERKREKSGQVGTLLPGLRIRRGQQRRKTLSLLLPSHANNNNNRHDGDADVLHWHDTHGTLLAVETRRRWNGTIEATEPRLEIVAQLEGPAVLDFLVAAWCMRNYNEAREVTKEPFRWELWEWEDCKLHFFRSFTIFIHDIINVSILTTPLHDSQAASTRAERQKTTGNIAGWDRGNPF